MEKPKICAQLRWNLATPWKCCHDHFLLKPFAFGKSHSIIAPVRGVWVSQSFRIDLDECDFSVPWCRWGMERSKANFGLTKACRLPAFGKTWMHSCAILGYWNPRVKTHPGCQTLLAAATIGTLAGGCPSKPIAFAICRRFKHVISRGHSGCWGTCCIEKEQVQESGAANWSSWSAVGFAAIWKHSATKWLPTVEFNHTGGILEGRIGIAAQPPESANGSCNRP